MTSLFSTLSRHIRLLEGGRSRQSPAQASAGGTRQPARDLNGQLVEACPPSAAYRLGKPARKFRRGLAAALLLFLVGGAVGACLAVQALEERVRAMLTESIKLDAIHRHAGSLDRAKERVINELISGRLGLLEAAARYRDLTSQRPGFDQDTYMRTFPGRLPEDQVWVRMVLRDARDVLSENAPKEQQAVPRLEAELEAWMRCGTPPLPRSHQTSETATEQTRMSTKNTSRMEIHGR